MAQNKRGRPAKTQSKVVNAIRENGKQAAEKIAGKMKEEVIDVEVEFTPSLETGSSCSSEPPLPFVESGNAGEPADPAKNVGIYRITKENKAEMSGTLLLQLMDTKNLVMAFLGAGHTVITLKEQEIVFSVLKAIDAAGVKVKKLKKMVAIIED